jgi:uncharacterized protein (PEP-CTERM system associated)
MDTDTDMGNSQPMPIPGALDNQREWPWMSMPGKLTHDGFLKPGICCVAALLWTSAWSADWKTSAQMDLEGTYTDNLFLDKTDKEGDFFLDITPGIVITGKGPRLDLDLAYSPQMIKYLSTSSSDQINHRLEANAQSELYKDHLFLEASANARQELIDSLGPSTRDASNPTNNLQTSSTYLLAPSYKNRFGRYADLSARFENNGVLYSEKGESSIGYKSNIELLSGPSFGAFQWGMIADNENIEYEESAGDRFTSVKGALGYQVNSRWLVAGLAGYEDNNYLSLDKTSGSVWELAGTWTPTQRTTLKFGGGYRYFGWTPVLELNHRHKRSAWTASYTRDISSARNDRTQAKVYEFKDAFGEPVVPATGDTLYVPVGEALPTSATYISNNFKTGYTLGTRRSTFGASIDYVLREYEGLTQDEETASATLSWTRRLTGLTSTNITLGWDWTERKSTLDNRDAETSNDFTLDTGVSRKLSARTSIELQYGFRNGDDDSENRVTLGLRTTWSK